MGQAVVDKDTARKREYLSLVLEPPERGREYKTVIITQKIAAHTALVIMIFLQSEPLVADQTVPVHALCLVIVHSHSSIRMLHANIRNINRILAIFAAIWQTADLKTAPPRGCSGAE